MASWRGGVRKPDRTMAVLVCIVVFLALVGTVALGVALGDLLIQMGAG